LTRATPTSIPATTRRMFLQQAAAALAASAFWRAAHAAGRVNPPALLEIEAGHYRFLPAGGVFCGGVVPDDGHQVVHAILRRWLPLAQGFAFVESYLSALGLPVQALCGMELRVPAAMTFDAFRSFNVPYVEQLRKWDLTVGSYSAVCRTNVAPALGPPQEACVHAFSYVAPGATKAPTFCVSGTADITPQGKIVAEGSTSAAAMKEKLEFVIGVIGNRLAELELEWNSATHVDLYLVADVPQLWGSTILPPLGLAAQPGVRLHYARPPIVGSEVELEARGLVQELTLST
jgi:hypothetical protein